MATDTCTTRDPSKAVLKVLYKSLRDDVEKEGVFFAVYLDYPAWDPLKEEEPQIPVWFEVEVKDLKFFDHPRIICQGTTLIDGLKRKVEVIPFPGE